MKYADINKRYTEIVNEYIAKDYTINTATMSGSQGEIAKIDFTDGTEIIRIRVASFSDYYKNIEGIEIIVGKSTDPVKAHDNDKMRNTVWDKNLEVLRRERFYQIGSWGTDYYGTEQEAKAASEKRLERYLNRGRKAEKYTPSIKAMQIAKRIVREKMGYQSINSGEVKLDKDRRGYVVFYKGKSYRLH